MTWGKLKRGICSVKSVALFVVMIFAVCFWPVTQAMGASGGPDGDRYIWNDSEGASFIDISASHTTLPLQDGNVLAASIGFSFSFYGVSYTNLYVCSNGVLQFQSSSLCPFRGDAIPSVGHYDPMIAALWEDLDPTRGGSVYYATTGSSPNRVFVLEFNAVPHYVNDSNPATFQVQLFETSNCIEIHYQSVPAYRDYITGENGNHVVGIERDSQTGLQYFLGTTFPATPRTVQFQRQATQVDTLINTHPANPSNSGNASFGFSGIESGMSSFTFSCRLDGGSYTACNAGSASYSGLVDGLHTFEVFARDSNSVADATPASFTWLVDTTKPSVGLSSMPANPTNQTWAHFTFIGSDGSGSGVMAFECKLDGNPASPCTSPVDLSTLADGLHTFKVRVTDVVGWTSDWLSFTWVICSSAPNLPQLTSPDHGSTLIGSNASLSWSSSSGATYYMVKVDGVPQNVGGNLQLLLSSLPSGQHTWSVAAYNLVGDTLGYTQARTFLSLAERSLLPLVAR